MGISAFTSTVAGLDGNIVGGFEGIELRAPHVGCEPVDDFQGPGIVNSELTGPVREGEFLVGTRLHIISGRDRSRSHLFWQVSCWRHGGVPEIDCFL